MTIEELLAAKKIAVAAMNKLLEDNPEDMDTETAAEFDALSEKVTSLDAQIERKKKVSSFAKQEETTGRRVPARAPVSPQQDQDDTGGFSSLNEFASAVLNVSANRGGVDERLNVLGATDSPHRESGGASGDGYMVPPHYSQRIFQLMLEDVDMMSMVDSEPTNSNTVQILKDVTTPWGSTGIQAYWGAEAGKLKRSNLDTRGSELKLHKLHAFVEATDELLDDAPRLNSRLTVGAAAAINFKANASIFEGNGTGKPLGFRESGSKIAIAKESGQAATTIVAANIAKMYSRCINPGKAVWFVNQDCLPQIMLLKYADGSPAWTSPNEGFKGAPGGFLMGRPIMFSEHCETLGAEGDIMFINPKGYYMPQKTGIKFSSSLHLLFDYDTQCFKWTFRLGGQPYLSSAVSPNKGSSTRSHCVLLAVRS